MEGAHHGYKGWNRGDDPVVVQHYLTLWGSCGTPAEHYRADAEEIVQTFIDQGRSRLGLTAFLTQVDGEVAGSAAGQLQVSPYANVIKATYRKFGYIQRVFVCPEFERRGFGRALTQAAVDYLRNSDQGIEAKVPPNAHSVWRKP